MPILVDMPSRGTQYEFPDEATPEQIQAAMLEAFPRNGEDVAWDLQDTSFEPSLEDFKKYRSHMEEKKVDWGDALIGGAGEIAKRVGKGILGLAEFESAAQVPGTAVEGVAAGTYSLYGVLAQSDNPASPLFKFKDWVSGTGTDRGQYGQFLEARKVWKNIREAEEGGETISGIDPAYVNQDVRNALELVADPSVFIPFAGGPKAAALAARAAGRVGHAAGTGVRAVGRAGTAVGAVPEFATTLGARAIGAPAEAAAKAGRGAGSLTTLAGVGEVGLGAAGAGVGLPFGTAAATFTGAKIIGGGLDAAGEAMQHLSRSMGTGASRTGAFAALAADESASLGARTLGGIGRRFGADAILPYVGSAAAGVGIGAGVGGTLGYLSQGEEGLFGGLGGGMVLGATGGLAGRGISHLTGGVRSQRIMGDASRAIALMPEAEGAKAQFLVERFAKEGNTEAIAEVIDAKGWLGEEAPMKFVRDDEVVMKPDGTPAMVMDADGNMVPLKGTDIPFKGVHFDDASNTIYINVDRAEGGTAFHESLHGALRTSIGKQYAKPMADALMKNLNDNQLGAYIWRYVDYKGLKGKAREQAKNDFLADPLKALEEINADYFMDFLQRRENRDLLLTGKRSVDNIILGNLKNAYDSVLHKLGMSEEYKLTGRRDDPFTGHKAVDSLVRELIDARRVINERNVKQGTMATPLDLSTPAKILTFNKEHGMDHAIIRDEKGNPIGVKDEATLRREMFEMGLKIDAALKDIPGAKEDFLSDKALAAMKPILPPEIFAKLMTFRALRDGGKVASIANSPVGGKKGEQTLIFPRGIKESDTLIHSARRSNTPKPKKDGTYSARQMNRGLGLLLKTIDLSMLRNRADEFFSRPGMLDPWGGDKAAAMADVKRYAENLASDAPTPSAEFFGGGRNGAMKRDILNKIWGAVIKAKQSELVMNENALGRNVRKESSGGGELLIGKPGEGKHTRVTEDIRVDRVGKITETGESYRYTEGEVDPVTGRPTGAYAGMQVNFLPDSFTPEKLPGGEAFVHESGYNILQKGRGKFRVYKPDGELLGLRDTMKSAASLAGRNFRKGEARFQPDRAERSRQDPYSELIYSNEKLPKGVTRDEQANLQYKGKQPSEWTPKDFKEFGEKFDVKNLGPLSKVKQVSDPVSGHTVHLPGGLEGKFTFYDLLWIKSNNPEVFPYSRKTIRGEVGLENQIVSAENISEGLHAKITDKLARTLTPPKGDKLETFNRMVFGMLSPNTPLLPNLFGYSRTKFSSLADVRRMAKMMDLLPENPTPKERKVVSDKIKKTLGIGAKDKGGLGIGITQDFTNIAAFAKLWLKKPEWFNKKPDEGWGLYVDRIGTQLRGLGTKTASFGGVWQDPAKAMISAVDRHMARLFAERVLEIPEMRKQFEAGIVNEFNKLLADSKSRTKELNAEVRKIRRRKTDEAVKEAEISKLRAYLEQNQRGKGLPDPKMRKAKTLDDVMAQSQDVDPTIVSEWIGQSALNAMGARQPLYRTKAGRGKEAGTQVNPGVREELRMVEFISDPEKFKVMSDAYMEALRINEEKANEMGVAIFPAQWTLWDRIRGRVEPHEVMFPGFHKLPKMGPEQIRGVLMKQSKMGYATAPGRVTETMSSPASMAHFMPDDSTYLAAVEKGDTATAQRLVDDAAKAAGYTTKGFHGTSQKFTVFDPEKSGTSNLSSALPSGDALGGGELGFHITADPNVAKGVGSNVLDVHVKTKNPAVVGDDPGSWDIGGLIQSLGLPEEAIAHRGFRESQGWLKQHRGEVKRLPSGEVDATLGWHDHMNRQAALKNDLKRLQGDGRWNIALTKTEKAQQIALLLDRHGFDSVLYRNIHEVNNPNLRDTYIVYRSNQIKSADPVTYNDAGKVIPLSERFGVGRDDIRFMPAEPLLGGTAWRNGAGYNVLQKGKRGKFRAYAPSGKLIGIYDQLKTAQKAAIRRLEKESGADQARFMPAGKKVAKDIELLLDKYDDGGHGIDTVEDVLVKLKDIIAEENVYELDDAITALNRAIDDDWDSAGRGGELAAGEQKFLDTLEAFVAKNKKPKKPTKGGKAEKAKDLREELIRKGEAAKQRRLEKESGADQARFMPAEEKPNFPPLPTIENRSPLGWESYVSDVLTTNKGGRVTLNNMKPGFHYAMKFLHILQHLGWERPGGSKHGYPNFSKPGARKIEKFLAQQMSDLIESLPQGKQVNAQTGEMVDPFFVVKKHFPRGEKGDVSQIIKNISDAMYTAEIRTIKSSQGDVHNLLEMAENLGVKIDKEIADIVAARAYGKGKSYREHKADAVKALAELSNPEFYDVQDVGEGVTLSTKIQNQ